MRKPEFWTEEKTDELTGHGTSIDGRLLKRHIRDLQLFIIHLEQRESREGKLREALEKISERGDAEDPEESIENNIGNYDDCFYAGKTQARYEAAVIARGALADGGAKGGEG